MDGPDIFARVLDLLQLSGLGLVLWKGGRWTPGELSSGGVTDV